jgi:hypothetical protein
LSTGEISRLGRLFLDYLERLHLARTEGLRGALEADGGWPYTSMPRGRMGVAPYWWPWLAGGVGPLEHGRSRRKTPTPSCLV